MSPVEMITEPLGQPPSGLDDVHETGVPNLNAKRWRLFAVSHRQKSGPTIPAKDLAAPLDG